MNYYNINLRACNGKLSLDKNDLILFLDEYELNETLFQMILGELIISSQLKEKLYEYLNQDCIFEKIDKLELRDDLNVSYTLGKELTLWRMIPTQSPIFQHITYYKNKYLVVSQDMLDLLIVNKGYKDYFAGSNYGKNWELLTSRLFLTQTIDKYFNENYLLDKSFLDKRLKEISNEGRKKRGLEPLHKITGLP